MKVSTFLASPLKPYFHNFRNPPEEDTFFLEKYNRFWKYCVLSNCSSSWTLVTRWVTKLLASQLPLQYSSSCSNPSSLRISTFSSSSISSSIRWTLAFLVGQSYDQCPISPLFTLSLVTPPLGGFVWSELGATTAFLPFSFAAFCPSFYLNVLYFSSLSALSAIWYAFSSVWRKCMTSSPLK